MTFFRLIFNFIPYIPILYAVYYRLIVRGFIFEWTLWNAGMEILSYIIISKIWLDFWKVIKNLFCDLFSYLKKPNAFSKQKIIINFVYKLPSELINFSLIIFLSFIVYKWFTSTPIIIALSAWVFKQINQDISSLIVLSIVYALKKPVKYAKDCYVSFCKTTANCMASAVYMPQKISSAEEGVWAINQGLTSYKNNYPDNNFTKKNVSNFFIYNCDTANINFKYKVLDTMLGFYPHYGQNLFMFSRNTQAKAKSFLWKPGAYISDYQILTSDINHAVTYTAKCFDTRRQLKIKREKNFVTYAAEHVPLCCDLDPDKKLRPDEDYEFFIKYFPLKYSGPDNLYLKENIVITKLSDKIESPSGQFKISKNNDLIDPVSKKVLAKQNNYALDGQDKYCFIKEKEKAVYISKHFLCETNGNFSKKLRVYLGSLFDMNNNLIIQDSQWEKDINGKIIYNIPIRLKKIYKDILPQYGIDMFSQKIKIKNTALRVDKTGNLIDDATGKIWAETDKFIVDFSFDLYKKENSEITLLEKNHIPDKKRIIGEDFRRLFSDRLNKIHINSLKQLIKDRKITQQEAESISTTGILGNDYLLHKGKNGWEKEYFIKNPDFDFFKKVTGGILIEDTANQFIIDSQNYLCKIKNKKIIRINEFSNACLLKTQDNILVKNTSTGFEIIRDISDRKPIKPQNKINYYYIQKDYFRFIKPASGGYVVNEKDGFFINDNTLWFVNPYNRNKKEVVSKDPDIQKLFKSNILIDYKHGKKLIERKYIAPIGSWYRGENCYRQKKQIGNLDFSFVNDNLDIFCYNPITEEMKNYSCGNYTLSKNTIWSNKKYIDDKILEKNEIKYKNGNLIAENIIAEEGHYEFDKNANVKITNGTIYPYGLYLKDSKNNFLKDKNGNFIPADVKINIVNQTDADTEFLPESISNLNSILTRNLCENKNPYLMLQPEISFRNTGASTFSRVSSWAQEMYKFIDKTLFNIYKRSTAYGKMTKHIESYTNNITFKESIPPIARTHDHWEAMKLKTGLVSSHYSKKKKILLENVPPSFLLYLKRQIGWLSGDLILLELETKFGVFLNLIRGVKQIIAGQKKEAKYWFLRALQSKHMIGYTSLPSSKERLESVKRTSFNPFLFGIWILIIGLVASIFPGTLSTSTPKIAWGLFWVVITGLIFLPKFIIPVLDLIKKFQYKYIRFFIAMACLAVGLFIGKTGLDYFPVQYQNITYYAFLGMLSFFIILKPLLIIAFGKYRRLKYRITSLLFCAVFFYSVFNHFLNILYNLEKVPSAQWIPYFIFIILPLITSYLIPSIFLMMLTKSGRSVLEVIRKGLVESLYSTSLLLMMVIYISKGLYSKVKFMVNSPLMSFSWIPAEAQKYKEIKPTVFNMYMFLSAAPLTSLAVIFVPIAFKIADYSLIFYGWPIFIWSWIFGPLFAYVTEKYGRNIHYEDLQCSASKKLFSLWIKEEFEMKQNFPSLKQAQEKILDLIPLNKHYEVLSRLKLLFLYFNEKLISFYCLDKKQLTETLNKKLILKNLNIDRLNEYNWETFSEIEKSWLILKILKKKHIKDSHSKMLKSSVLLLFKIGVPKPGSLFWHDLKTKTKEKIINSSLLKKNQANIPDFKETLLILAG